MAAQEWEIGSRVQVAPENDVATVRFVGAVAGTEGEWVGVEFDTAGRGKHDGVHQGVRYFACSAAAGAQAAAFVRPHKLRRGVTLLEALVTKYEQASPAATQRAGLACRASHAPAGRGRGTWRATLASQRTPRGQRLTLRLARRLMRSRTCTARGAAASWSSCA